MNLFHIIFLGIIEGLTEFIPVSSTGHLILFTEILEIKTPPGKVFEIAIQLGAILAICLVYHRRITKLATGMIRQDKQEWHFALAILIAFLPAAIIGIFAHSYIKEILFSAIVVAIMLIIGGIIILIVESRVMREKISTRFNAVEDISWHTALYIGFFQAIAMIPGTSRSGATIIGARILGVGKKAATEFSFFLAIPTMFGATIYDLYKNYHLLNIDHLTSIAIGFIAALLSAMIVVRFIVGFIETHGFTIFGYYRIIVGILILAIMA